MMVDNFTDMVNEPFVTGGHNDINSDSSKETSDLNDLLLEVLFRTKKTQEQHEAGRGGSHLPRRSSESLRKIDWEGSDSLNSRWHKSKGDYISSVCHSTPC